MLELLKEWNKKMLTSRTEKEREICRKRIEKIQQQMEAENPEPEKTAEPILNVNEKEKLNSIRNFTSDFGFIAWDSEKQLIDINGSVWQEKELDAFHQSGFRPSHFELRLKRLFPSVKLRKIKKNEYQED